jgi:carboxyl-terminal processing protease
VQPRTRLLIALLSTALTGYVALGTLLGRVFGDTTYGQLSIFNEVVRIVIDAYVEPVNLDRTMAGADLGLTEALDGDSSFLNADEFRALQQAPPSAEAEVGVVLTRRFGFLMVVSLRPGSPAEKAGLRTGDILKTIDARHSRTIAVATGERLLRGAPGSVVRLKVMRPGSDPLDFSLVRERLLGAEPERKTLDDGTGYLKVREFTAHTAEQVRGEVEVLKKSGARKLILDLRGAGYGAAADAVKVAEIFQNGGVVTKLVGRKTTEQVMSADASKSLWDLPLAVLVDTGTAGPGEIVAGSLLESERAQVVGERTFGRAGVQKTIPLPDGGLVLTVAKYATPKGNPIHGHGIAPSVPVQVPDDLAPASEAGDPILDRALEVLKSPAKKKAA